MKKSRTPEGKKLFGFEAITHIVDYVCGPPTRIRHHFSFGLDLFQLKHDVSELNLLGLVAMHACNLPLPPGREKDVLEALERTSYDMEKLQYFHVSPEQNDMDGIVAMFKIYYTNVRVVVAP